MSAQPITCPDQPVLHEVPFMLAYGDCDPAGIVYYATYYRWFERVYTEWTLLGGFPTPQMHEVLGATHVTVASGCSYLVPGRLHDRFRVRVRLDRVGTTSLSLAFSVDHETEERAYAKGTMTLVFVDQRDVDSDERPRPVPVPEGMKRALRDAGCVF